MNKYEFLEVIGEGTYGIVIKARNKENGQYFAIKKFKSNAKPFIKRELNMLNCLKSCPFVVSLKEAIRRKEKIYFIFEYIDKNLLQVFQENPHGLSQKICKSLLFQLCKAIEKCHSLDIIHRDIKPENLLIDQNYNLKLCDFGFARHITPDDHQEPHTEYVATRWYRSPELLLMSPYDKAVDIWALGCLAFELTNSKPLFPGRSDLDQLHLIIQTMGSLPETFLHDLKNSVNAGYNIKSFKGPRVCVLDKKFQSHVEDKYVNFVRGCLELNPRRRMNIQECLTHPLLEQQRKAYIQANSNGTVISSLKIRDSMLEKPPSRMATRMSESRLGDVVPAESRGGRYENQIPRLNTVMRGDNNSESSYKNPVMNLLNSLSNNNNPSSHYNNDSFDETAIKTTSRSHRNGKSQETLFSNSLSHVDDHHHEGGTKKQPKDILSFIKALPTVRNDQGTLVQRSKSFFALNKGYMGKSEEGLYDLNNTYESLDKTRAYKNLNYSLDGKSNKYKSENFLKLKPIKQQSSSNSNYMTSTMILDAPSSIDEAHGGLTKSLRLSSNNNNNHKSNASSFLNNLSRKC